ncbi:MAG TPA: hypothetical protein VLA38_09745, partial [Steroidobacteraceae bacterium]|nr:hypothetical protein [Steroidobacteraceae bacterium]
RFGYVYPEASTRGSSSKIMENRIANDTSEPQAVSSSPLVAHGEVDHDRINRHCKPSVNTR